MGDQAISNNINHKKRLLKCNIHKQIGREITSRVIDYQVPNKRDLASYYHGGFTITRGRYLVNGKKIRKGMKGMNDS